MTSTSSPQRFRWDDSLALEAQLATMQDEDLRKRLNVPRSTLPAITHVDNSARIQTVDEERHGRDPSNVRAACPQARQARASAPSTRPMP